MALQQRRSVSLPLTQSEYSRELRVRMLSGKNLAQMEPSALRASSLIATVLLAGCGGVEDLAPHQHDAGSHPNATGGDAATDGRSPDAMDGTSPDSICADLAQLSIGPVIWSNVALSPGSGAQLTIGLANRDPYQKAYGAGVALSCMDSPVIISPWSVNPRSGAQSVVVLSPNAGKPLPWMVTFNSALSPGSVVRFHSEVFTEAELENPPKPPCRSVAHIDFDVALQ